LAVTLKGDDVYDLACPTTLRDIPAGIKLSFHLLNLSILTMELQKECISLGLKKISDD
jgi:hypothetical protein